MPISIESSSARLRALQERWSTAHAAERANAQLYLTELCDALDVERPRPAGSGYEFEYPIKVINRDGTETTNFIDLFKRDFFVLEAKDQQEGKPTDLLMRKAFGQARTYASAVEGTPPPYLMVLDVGATLMVWDRWSGSYGGFNAGRRINLRSLATSAEDIALLRDVWERPSARDPRIHAAAVTREIAGKLAELAARLEGRGHAPETVARFLIRCIFTAFAEDVGLLPERPFESAIREIGFSDPEDFSAALEELWRAMDQGKRFGLRKLLHFNGHFFHEAQALPLTREDLVVLHQAARADWAQVEPSIFGTLLVRALDPVERHRLGAEYTPRAFVERLVRPTVEEPIRERWTAVQAEVLQLLDGEGKVERTIREHRQAALSRLRDFHKWLRGLRFLDPACGSGNFLYVTMHLVKRIELEVLRMIEEITGQPELGIEEVGPWQFYGIEVKPWARELAELVLWIGYHQFWTQTHGQVLPPEPILKDTGTLEQRDAVLAWDETVEVSEKSRLDPTPRIVHPVSGRLVPDPEARLPYYEYRGARPAEWPEADFIVGNPPYLGKSLMKLELGDGYVNALRKAYPQVPDGADLVMYWWFHAAKAVASGKTFRAGLITTSSIRQGINRKVVERAIEEGVRLLWAVADHPWVEGADGADVTVSMTVIGTDGGSPALGVTSPNGESMEVARVSRINADLTSSADIAAASQQSLRSNRGLAANGFCVYGRGFVLEEPEAAALIQKDLASGALIRRVKNGRDLAARDRQLMIIDFGLRDEAEAKQFPFLYSLIRDRVKPERDSNKDKSMRENWWRFGRNREESRPALESIARHIVTLYTGKHQWFTFIDSSVACEDTVICIGLDDWFSLGVLSSSIHVAWVRAAGSRLGVGNDLRYNKTTCFDPYPFPDVGAALRTKIGQTAEQLERLRRAVVTADERITITMIYNVIEKLRAGIVLNEDERLINSLAACGSLRDFHDELDALVAEAYGWPWPMHREEILERLAALHDERVEEEKAGRVRWLRPDYQIPKFGRGIEPEAARLPFAAQTAAASDDTAAPWPTGAAAQIISIQSLLAKTPLSADETAARLRGARKDLVARHLETLALMGEVRVGEDGVYHPVREAA